MKRSPVLDPLASRYGDFTPLAVTVQGDDIQSAAVCGNAAIEFPEQCDNGEITALATCSYGAIACVVCNERCQLVRGKTSFCGDGTVDAAHAEQCDDGNAVDGDGCSALCIKEFCGDGILQPQLNELCDDDNFINGDGCSSLCLLERCGDGTLQTQLGEQYDDGNNVNGDGCNQVCVKEFCGDGVLQPALGEQCEDGNTDDSDTCLSTCQLATCGDGFIQAGVEECDDSNTDNADTCLNSCKEARCGDGFVQTGEEECDFGDGVWADPYNAWIGPVELVAAKAKNIVVVDVVDGSTIRVIDLGTFGVATGRVDSLLSLTTPLSYTGYPVDIYTNGWTANNGGTGCIVVGESADAESGEIKCWKAGGVFGNGDNGPGPAVQAKKININAFGSGRPKLYVACALTAEDGVRCWVSNSEAMDGQAAQMQQDVPLGSFRTVALVQAFSGLPIACATPQESTLPGGDDGDVSDGINTPVCWGPGLEDYGSWSGDLNGKIFTDVLAGGKNLLCAIVNHTGHAADGGMISCLAKDGSTIDADLLAAGLDTTQHVVDLDIGNNDNSLGISLCVILKGNTMAKNRVVCTRTDIDTTVFTGKKLASISTGSHQVCAIEETTKIMYCSAYTFYASMRNALSTPRSNLSDYACTTGFFPQRSFCHYCDRTTCTIQEVMKQ
ncbi:MAG: DUF4215 domain-containing protein [Myxococcota bacterium]